MPAEIESLTNDLAARRTGTGVSPMLVALVVLGLLLAAYAHWRFGQFADRIDRVRDQLAEMRGEQDRLSSQVKSLATRLDVSEDAWRNELRGLREVPAQVGELGQSVEELRARTEAPQRAWVRAEAMYLLQLAERRLDLEGDVATAITAMESADARLAALKDPATAEVRRQLGQEIAALRAVQLPDLPDVLARISRIEMTIPTLPVLGIPVSKGQRAAAAAQPQNAFARIMQRISQATRDLFSLRRIDPETARLVAQEEESLRRQHLELQLFAARVAAMQPDRAAYLQSLRAAETWLAQFFDTSAREGAAARAEIAALATVDIDPPRPEIGAASRLLQRVIGGGATTP
jgi:uroporphyrin-3 C-methyltransferase